MNQGDRAFWGWPGWLLLRLALLLTVGQTAWFYLIYGGTNYVTGQRTLRIPVHFDWELDIPFVPASVLVYMSIYLLFAAAPFILRTRREVVALTLTLMSITAAGGIVFLLLPAELAFPPPPSDVGIWTPLCHIAREMALKYNLLPSLHVALSVACVAIYAARAAPAGKMLLWAWATAVALSTLLLHQHHLLDVLAGWFLGFAGKICVFDRVTVRRQTLPANLSSRREPPV
jgi:membrane-associated phospholipid phosphatase